MPPTRPSCGLVVALLCALAGAAWSSGCQVPNPAYDRVTTPDGERLDASAAADGGQSGEDALPPFEAGLALDGNEATSKTALPGCDPTNADLALCLRFEGALLDESRFRHALEGRPGWVQGQDGLALNNPQSSSIKSAASPEFATLAFTIETWIRLSEFPTDEAKLIVGLPGVVSLSLTPQRELVCRLRESATREMVSAQQLHGLQPGVWAQVACVFDGASANMYVNGKSAGGRPIQVADTILPPTSQAHIGGTSDTGRLEALLDNVRVWRRRLRPDELCAAAPECVM